MQSTRKAVVPRSNPGPDLYVRFLHLAQAVTDVPLLPPLDPLEERMLAQIARARQRNERLSVRDIMANQDLGAPATIHNRLKSMRTKGWIWLADTEDGRRKQLELTEDALRHFARLSRAMVKATQS